MKWDRKKCGFNIRFIDDYTIVIGEYFPKSSICCAEYIIDSSKYSFFSWTVKVLQISDGSWIGFINAQFINSKDCTFDTNLHSSGKYLHSFGFGNGYKYIFCSDDLRPRYKTEPVIELPNASESNIKRGDEFRMDVDFNKREIECFYNDISFGVIWKNIPRKFVPAVSNNKECGGFIIINKHLI